MGEGRGGSTTWGLRRGRFRVKEAELGTLEEEADSESVRSGRFRVGQKRPVPSRSEEAGSEAVLLLICSEVLGSRLSAGLLLRGESLVSV